MLQAILAFPQVPAHLHDAQDVSSDRLPWQVTQKIKVLVSKPKHTPQKKRNFKCRSERHKDAIHCPSDTAQHLASPKSTWHAPHGRRIDCMAKFNRTVVRRFGKNPAELQCESLMRLARRRSQSITLLSELAWEWDTSIHGRTVVRLYPSEAAP